MILTDKFMRLARSRAVPMKYSYCTMIQWDKAKDRVFLHDTPLRFMGTLQFAGYSLMMSIFTVYLLYRYLFQDWSNGKWDIYDVTFPQRNLAMETLTHMYYGGYLAAMTLLAGCWSRLILARHQVVEFVNMNLDFIFYYQEKYKDLISGNPDVKKQARVTDGYMHIIAIMSAVTPMFFGFILFQPVWPEYWVLNVFLEIPFQLELKFLPLLIILNVCILQAGDMIFWVDFLGLIYFQGSVYIMHLFEPQSIHYDKNGNPRFMCRLGCELELEEVMKLFEEQRLFSKYINDIYGHLEVTAHHGSFLILTTAGLYICLRYPGYLLVPGLQLAIFACIGPDMLEYFEMLFVTSSYNKSDSYIQQLKTLTGNEKKTLKIKVAQKYVKARRALQIELAYPFYSINRENYAALQNQIVDVLVNLLVATTR